MRSFARLCRIGLSLLLHVKIHTTVALPLLQPDDDSATTRTTGKTLWGRRDAISAGIATAASTSAGLLFPYNDNDNYVARAAAIDQVPHSFRAYQVEPDASAALSPTLTAVTNDSFLQKISSTQALWLGEHHNAAEDHNLQVEILRQIAVQRRQNNNNNSNHGGPVTAVGLEQVQVKFQPVLDEYSAGTISSQELRIRVEWDQRWMWPFDVYEAVFETARALHMPLIALNVNSEDLELVETGGLRGLPVQRLREYIRDASGFATFANTEQFRTYVDYAIVPSYQVHQAMGLLQYTMSGQKLEQEMSFRNFLSSRILWDEAMASNAYEWTNRNKGGLLVGLVGADHVKFRNGIPGRYARMVGDAGGCMSVMLNPTLIDTRPSGTVASTDAAMSSQRPDSITLQLRYLKEGVDLSAQALPESTGGVLPLADYLVIGQ